MLKICNRVSLLSYQSRFFASLSSQLSENVPLESNPAERSSNFYLFDRPKVVAPLMEPSRKIGGNIAESIYQLAFERGYSRKSLIKGANEGASLIGSHIADKNWKNLASIAVGDLVESAQIRREEISDSEAEFLRFKTEDIVHSFLFSSVIAGKNMFKLSSSRNIGIYFTVVSLVRRDQNIPSRLTLTEATKKYKNELFGVNVTFARTLNPLGPWKSTSFNVFSLE